MLYWVVTVADHLFGTLAALLSCVVFLPLTLFRVVLVRRPADLALVAAACSALVVAGFIAWRHLGADVLLAGSFGATAAVAAPIDVMEVQVDPQSGCEFLVPVHGFGLIAKIGPDGRQVCIR